MIADLSGRKALVTGAGTSGGLGGTIAAVLAEQGADVAVADINRAGATEVAAGLEGLIRGLQGRDGFCGLGLVRRQLLCELLMLLGVRFGLLPALCKHIGGSNRV